MCDYCEWDYWLQEMEDMIDSGDFEKSEDFIQNVFEWVEEKEHITEKQIAALEKIKGGEFR